jgi:hypothetical protein
MAARICLLSCAGFMLVMLTAYACCAADGEIIGQTSVFHLVPDAVLIASDPLEEAGVQAFNYFFCLEVFFAIFAVWVKMLLSVFKREVH